MGAKEKLIVERLTQIREQASEMNRQVTKRAPGVSGADLAEEAAGLGLELAELQLAGLQEKK